MKHHDPRFDAAVLAAQEGHPFAAQVDPALVGTEFSLKVISMSWNSYDLDDKVFYSQIAQALDRSLINAGIMAKRHHPVDLNAAPTAQTRAVAGALQAKRSARRIGIADPTQIARLAAALDEAICLEKKTYPALDRDRIAQKVSGMLFKAALLKLDHNKEDFPTKTDAAILEFCQGIFAGMRTKIGRLATA